MFKAASGRRALDGGVWTGVLGLALLAVAVLAGLFLAQMEDEPRDPDWIDPPFR